MDTSGDEGSVNEERAMSENEAQSEEENEVDEQQKQNSDNDSVVASSPRSPITSDREEQSDDEVHVSNPESAASDDEAHSSREEKDNEYNSSENEAVSDNEERNEEMQDDAEEDRESVGSVPEIEIDSGDEHNETDHENRTLDETRDSDSENEHGQSDEKPSSPANENEASSPPSPKQNSDNEEIGSPVHKSPRTPPESDGEHKKIESDNEDGTARIQSDEEQAKNVESDDEENATKMELDNEENAKKMESDNEENDKEMESDTSPVKKSRGVNRQRKDTDGEGDDNEKKNLIANIFGDSDEEKEREGDDGDDEDGITRKKKKKRARIAQSISDSDDEDGESKAQPEEREQPAEIDGEEANANEGDAAVKQNEEDKQRVSSQAVSDDESDDDRKMREDFVSDFDLMMQKKKEESSKRRKRRDVDIINDSDDLIAEIISEMRQAADEDRFLNKQKKTATKKLRILPLVMSQLKKQDLKMAFLDQGVLNVMADWLAPLPDRSLPNLQIREGMIKQLLEFPSIHQSLLKASGVGRALMYLYKHPKETKENKERAGKLITEWSRPIFNVTTDYHSLTKEEREQRDFDHIPKKKKLRGETSELEESPEKKDIEKALNQSDKKLRPGDKGWVGRARVPLPSNKDYVYRPKWNVEMELGRAPTKKPLNRFEKHIRTMQEKKRNSKGQRAVTISIEGRKMAI